MSRLWDDALVLLSLLLLSLGLPLGVSAQTGPTATATWDELAARGLRVVVGLIAALALAFAEPHPAAAQPTGTDRTALEALYDATDGANWGRNTNWKTTDGEWSGVFTDSAGNVTRLVLSYNQLNGTIPAALGDLSNLTDLDLDGNDLSGTIPAALGNLSNLTDLFLANNQLSGPIPDALGNLTNLTELDLSTNELSGTIPAALGNLSSLD